MLEKIKSVLKEDDVHTNLIILILFSIRILILRLRRETLNGVFKSMWPFILFLLEKLIKPNKWADKSPGNEVLLAAFKLLEIISCLDIDEFNLHKWAFVFEHYGVSLNSDAGPRKGVGIGPGGSGPFSPFQLNPMLLSKTPRNTEVNYSDDRFKEVRVQTKRKLLITQNKMDAVQLEFKVMEFLTYIVMLSSSNLELEKEELESLIQGDFIEFGNFINL